MGIKRGVWIRRESNWIVLIGAAASFYEEGKVVDAASLASVASATVPAHLFYCPKMSKLSKNVHPIFHVKRHDVSPPWGHSDGVPPSANRTHFLKVRLEPPCGVRRRFYDAGASFR